VREALRRTLLTTLGYPAKGVPSLLRVIARVAPTRLHCRARYGYDGFPPFVAGGHALDIGCGNGHFLTILQRHGWTVTGVDTSPAAARAAEAQGVVVHTGDVFSLQTREQVFDYVHMSHVVEHLGDPVATLRHVLTLLRPGGSVYIETPNIAAWSAAKSGPYWYPLDTPRHLWLFAPKTLRQALTTAGFVIDNLRTKPMRSWYAWDVTYREEERTGHLLASRPSITWRGAIGALVLGASSRLVPRTPDVRGETIACWASAPR
jgi:2-polyprenyl-3-methyl-5-hydroxy-6-metoxy-1,4-benzoquinol methylase